MAVPSELPDLSIPTLPNLRDVGGWETDAGRVRRGLLYRSVELGKLDDEGLTAFSRLGVRTVYDLRTETERDREPDRVPAGTNVVPLDVLADAGLSAPAQLMDLLGDPARASEALGGGHGIALFEDAYRQIVSLPSALSAYRALYTGLTEPAARPALFHCTTGKDRTGWGAAALLMFLGVDDEDVHRDYLLTNDELLPALQPMFDAFTSGGGDAEVLKLVLGVRPEYLAAAVAEMLSRYGSIESYFTDGLGLDAVTQDALRTAFVEPR